MKTLKQNDVLWGYWFTEYYLKSEADKVIEELKAENESLSMRKMNLFVKKDERVHFSFSKLNIVGETGLEFIFSPALEWSESEIIYIQESLVKILPLIGTKTVCEFYIYNEKLDGYPKSFISKKFIGVNGLFEILQDYIFEEKE